jgi:hypothetical protein
MAVLMMDYLFITIQAQDGVLFQAQKMVSGILRADMDPGIETYIWESLDQHILAEVGWVDRHRYSFEREMAAFMDPVFPQERYADDGHDRWPGLVVHLLDGPRAGEDYPYLYVGGSKVLEIPVMDAHPSIWDSTISPEEMAPVPYRVRTLSYQLHNRYGELFGTIR